MPGSRELMIRHVEALYVHDGDGRIVRVNEHEGAPAPRFFLGRTAEGMVCRFRHDVDDLTRRGLEAAVLADASLDDAGDPVAVAEASLARYAGILARTHAVERTEAGPAFAFPATLPAPGDAVVRVTAADAHVLQPLMPAWLPDVERSAPLFATVIDGRAVAVCASVRITPRAHEAGVETVAAFRGRGHALAVVAAWARAVRAMGAEPLYSTSWRNAASRAVTRKLGLLWFGSDLHVT